jgi:3-oxoacyl-[acyl-carrier protein] reductase
MGERVLVSGGSGGIGSALVRRLAASGYVPVIGFARNSLAAGALAAETKGVALPLDLTEPATIDAAVHRLAEESEPLAGVVLAASPPPVIEPLFKIAEDEMARQWTVNVDGPRRLLGGIVRRCLRARKRGWVVGVLSRAMGIDEPAAKSMGSYVIAKHGLQGLLKAVEAEYPWLRVLTVSPDYTETEMLKAFDERFLDQMRERAPRGRFSTPEEVADDIMARIEEAD